MATKTTKTTAKNTTSASKKPATKKAQAKAVEVVEKKKILFVASE